MSVGTQPNWAYLNSQATQIVLQARTALAAITNFNTYLAVGLGASNLEAIATAAQDANATADVTELLSIFANLAAVAAVCNGEAYDGPPLPFNFVAQTVPLWNAQ
jgi:hypothetical protein